MAVLLPCPLSDTKIISQRDIFPLNTSAVVKYLMLLEI